MYGYFLILCCVVVYAQDVITCQHQDDYFHFLYKICIQSTPCRHLFHLYPLEVSNTTTISATPERDGFIDYRNERDYQLFRHQLYGKPIFHTQAASSERLVLHHALPDAWIPTTSVVFNQDIVACSSNEPSTHLALHVLYALHIYKMVIADDYYCHDPNERFLIDPLTNQTLCICKTGKSCNNDSNFDDLFFFLMVILIVAIVAACISIFASLFYKRAMLHDLSRQSI